MLHRQCQSGALKKRKRLQNLCIDKRSTCESLDKVHSIHLDTEDNFAGNTYTTNIEHLITLGTGECFDEGVLYSTVESIYNCCVKDSSNVERVGEHPQDGNISEKVDFVESAYGNSRTEVLYWEILDVSCRNQVL